MSNPVVIVIPILMGTDDLVDHSSPCENVIVDDQDR